MLQRARHRRHRAGSQLLVAPALSGKERSKRSWVGRVQYRYVQRKVYLPQGTWTGAWHLLDSPRLEVPVAGQELQLEVRYGQPAVFWRSDWPGADDFRAALKQLDLEFPGYSGGVTADTVE